MTTQEFKESYPEYAHLKGNDLWDAMENHQLKIQAGEGILNQIKPFYKRYQLRYLFYRVKPNMVFGSAIESETRCSKCKNGVNSRMVFLFTNEDGTTTSVCNCPHCNEPYVAEPNTNFSLKLIKAKKWFVNAFWWLLEAIHLVRSDFSGRYDMFGDEMGYVLSWNINLEKGTHTYELKKRKWWEYIFIEKR